MNTKVAVIMPVYNAEKTLPAVIKGVLNQTHRELELFVVDDASTDGGLALVKELTTRDARVTVLPLTRNGGPSEARNHALRLIWGRGRTEFGFIAYCDADDVWEPDHLKRLIDDIGDAGLVYSDPCTVFADGSPAFAYGIPHHNVFPGYEELFKNNFIYISGVLHRFDCLFEGAFDKDLDSIEDHDYWLRVLEGGWDVKHLCRQTFRYTCRPDGVGSTATNAKYIHLYEKRGVKRLNLGCGDDVIRGWVNCDLYAPKADVKCDIGGRLPFDDESVTELLSSHTLEHFSFKEAFDVLREWRRVLKPGGKLTIETPDMYHTCKKFVEGDEQTRIRLYGHFFAWPWEPGQCHKFLYTQQQLSWTLQETGYKEIHRVSPKSHYVVPGWEDLYLRMECQRA